MASLELRAESQLLPYKPALVGKKNTQVSTTHAHSSHRARFCQLGALVTEKAEWSEEEA